MTEPQGNPHIVIHNINTNTNSPHPSSDPNKKDNGKTAIWVAIIGLIGVIGVPLLLHFLPKKEEPAKDITVSTECSDLKKQLKQQTSELTEIETMLKSKPSDLKLQADKIAHSNNIQSINTKLQSIKCD